MPVGEEEIPRLEDTRLARSVVAGSMSIVDTSTAESMLCKFKMCQKNDGVLMSPANKRYADLNAGHFSESISVRIV